jgi:hypothetical protein
MVRASRDVVPACQCRLPACANASPCRDSSQNYSTSVTSANPASNEAAANAAVLLNSL